MKKEKIDKLLIKAKNFRDNGLIADALATLYQVMEACPDELKYKYLLAATFFEAESYDDARFYASEVIAKDANSKEAFELSGLINAKDEKYADAEIDFKKALEIDINFHSARFNLFKLYYEYWHNDEELIKNAYYMLEHRDMDRNLLPRQQKKAVLFEWYAYVYGGLVRALVRQKKYKEVIKLSEEYITYSDSCLRKPSPIDHIGEYGNIYKCYFLMNDEAGLKAFKEREKEIFSIHRYQIDWEKHYNFMEELAKNGIF